MARKQKDPTAKVKVTRDARTGKFVPTETADRRPSTTVVETIRKPRKPKGLNL